MWARGPTPGYSPKFICLKFEPDAICVKNEVYGIKGFTVYKNKSEMDANSGVASAASAAQAWDKALDAFGIRYDHVNSRWVRGKEVFNDN